MSYLAIARKWRPMVFDEIVGQKHVTHTLQNAIRMERIHHAFLFTGPRGVGKTTAARILARALCCEHGPTPEPCGTCVICKAILAGSAPDVIEIDGASNNSVDDVRELREGVRYLPSQARYRIYIIDEVHMLTRQAFNALLKTLEEPPPHVAFVFATTEPQKIPETILSRIQRFDFKRIPGTAVAGRLASICEAEGVRVSEHALRLVARAGEGSMRDAQSLLDQVISFAGLEIEDSQVTELLGLVDRSILYEMLAGLVQGEPARCLDAIAQVHEYGFEMDQFTAELLELLRNAALVAMAPEERRHLDLSDDELERLRALVVGLPPDVFARWFDALLEVHDRVARAQRPRMVLEMAVARLASIRPVQGLDRIMARLEDLDRRLRKGGFQASPGAGGRGGPPFHQGGVEQPRARPQPSSFTDAAPPPAVEGAPASPPPRVGAPAGPEASPRPEPGPPPPEPAPSAQVEPRQAPPPREEAMPPQPPPRGTLVASPPQRLDAPSPDPTPRRPREQAPEPPSAARPARGAEPKGAEGADASGALPLPTVDPGADAHGRYQAILAVLASESRWKSLVEHSVALSWSGEELRVAFGSESQLGLGRPLLSSGLLRPLLEAAFPGLGRVDAVLREQAQGRPETRHEARKIARGRYLKRLRQEVEDDAVLGKLRQELGLELLEFTPTDSSETSP